MSYAEQLDIETLTKEDLEQLATLVRSPIWAIYVKLMISNEKAYKEKLVFLGDESDIRMTQGLIRGFKLLHKMPSLVVAQYEKLKKAEIAKAEVKNKRHKKAAPVSQIKKS